MKEYIPSSLRRSLRQIRLVFDYCHVLISLRKQRAGVDLSRAKHVVVFDFTDPSLDRNFGRYTYILIKYFSIHGWTIVLKNALEPVANLKRLKYKNWLTKIPNLYISSRPDLPNAVYFYDRPNNKKNVEARQLIQLKDFQHGQTYEHCDVRFPFTMHPFFYEKGRYQQVGQLRANERLIRLLFSGKMDPSLYKKQALKERYSVLNRIDILEHLTQNLKPSYINKLNSSHEFDQLIAQGFFRGQFIYGERIIRIGEWLEGLSRADFFLACPGTDMPMCHNIIEAMAVGCIPIIEFPEQLVPSLEDDGNCLVFRGKTHLIQRVRDALAMEQGEIERLREGVIAYYDKHLAPDRIIQRITSMKQHDLRLCMEMS